MKKLITLFFIMFAASSFAQSSLTISTSQKVRFQKRTPADDYLFIIDNKVYFDDVTAEQKMEYQRILNDAERIGKDIKISKKESDKGIKYSLEEKVINKEKELEAKLVSCQESLLNFQTGISQIQRVPEGFKVVKINNEKHPDGFEYIVQPISNSQR